MYAYTEAKKKNKYRAIWQQTYLESFWVFYFVDGLLVSGTEDVQWNNKTCW